MYLLTCSNPSNLFIYTTGYTNLYHSCISLYKFGLRAGLGISSLGLGLGTLGLGLSLGLWIVSLRFCLGTGGLGLGLGVAVLDLGLGQRGLDTISALDSN